MAANPEKTPRPKCLLELVTMFEPRVWEQEPAPRHFKQCMRVFPWPVRKKDEHESSSSAYCWKGRSAELIRFTDLRRSIACMGMPNPTFERAALDLSEPSPSSMAEYDRSGYTSLHHAAAEGDVGTATYLLEYSASLTVDTPIQVPETPEPRLSDWGNPWPMGHLNYRLSQHTQVRDVGLVMSNATPLHIASFFGQEEMVEFLLKKGAKPNAYARIDKYDACRRNTWVDGVTAMYLAIQEEHVGMVKLLIQHGASIFNYVPFSTEAFPLIDLVQWIVGKPTGIVKCWQSAANSRQSYSNASAELFIPIIAVMQPAILWEILAMPEVTQQLNSLPPGVEDFISDCMVAFAASKCRHELRDSHSRPPFDCELVAHPRQHLLDNSRVSSPVKMLGDLLAVMANFNMLRLATLRRLLACTVLYKRAPTQVDSNSWRHTRLLACTVLDKRVPAQVDSNSWRVPPDPFQVFFQDGPPGMTTSAGVSQETVFSAKTCVDIILLLMSFGVVPQRDLQQHLSASSLSAEAKKQNNLLLYQAMSEYDKLCATAMSGSAAPYRHMIQILLDLGWTAAGWNASQGSSVILVPPDSEYEGRQNSLVRMHSIHPSQAAADILCAIGNPMSLVYAAQTSILRSLVNPANISKLPLPSDVKECLRAYPHRENPFE